MKVKLRWTQLQDPVATGLVPERGVEDEEQLVHGCDHDHLPGFALTALGVEVADGRVVTCGGHRGWRTT